MTTALLVALCAVLIALPTPPGLSQAGHRVLAVVALAIGLWCTEALPMGVTGMLVVMALVLSGGVAGFPEALVGFAQPVAYFLIGVLTIGLAVLRSGLAERVAWFFLRRSRGEPGHSTCKCCWRFLCLPCCYPPRLPVQASSFMSMSRPCSSVRYRVERRLPKRS